MKRTGRQKDIVTPEKKQEQRELLRLFSANIRKILKNTDLLADDLQDLSFIFDVYQLCFASTG